MSVIDNHLAPAPSPLEEVVSALADQANGMRAEERECGAQLETHRAQVALWTARRDSATAAAVALEASLDRMKAEEAARAERKAQG